MIIKFIVSFIFLSLLFFPQTVSAHLAGQPPYFKINNVYSNLYPVPTTSLSDFNLPQDLAAENYLVNQPLQFLLETNQLPVPEEIVKQSKFDWDYGDGSAHGTGLSNTHVYSKMGSYILTINVTSPDTNQPQLLQSVLMNILPNKNYQLPQSTITVNGQKAKDPLTDVLKISFDQKINFDSSLSKSSSPITSYFWDFGDGETSANPKDTHHYNSEVHQYFPLLRIKTADGFLADSFVEVESDETVPSTFNSSNNKKMVDPKLAMGVGGLAAAAVLFWYFKPKKKTKR